MERKPVACVQLTPPFTLKFTPEAPFVQLVVNCATAASSGVVAFANASYAGNVIVDVLGVKVVHDCAMLAVTDTFDV